MKHIRLALSVALLLSAAVPGWASPLRFQSIKISRTSCEGTCPVYSVRISADGNVDFEGESGKRTRKVSAADIQLLAAAVSRVGQVDSQFNSRVETCIRSIVDIPNTYIAIETNGQHRTLLFNAYCTKIHGVTQAGWLADTVDEIAGTEQWLERP